MIPIEPKSYPNNKSITAIGIIIPVEWDVQRNPVRVALSTNNENEYMIDRRSRKGREIAKLVRAQVKIEGILNEKGSIIVKHYEPIDYESIETKPRSSAGIINIPLTSKEK